MTHCTTDRNKRLSAIQPLSVYEVEAVVGANAAYEAGYEVGNAIAYIVGGGAGRDLGSWLYDVLN